MPSVSARKLRPGLARNESKPISAGSFLHRAEKFPPGSPVPPVGTRAGFKRAEVGLIRVNAGPAVTQEVQLELGAVSEVVEVSAQALNVETTTARSTRLCR